MPTPTYTPLANITLGSSASTVSFSSISQLYRDLVLVVRNNGTGYRIRATFNSDTGSNYYGVTAEGSGSYTGSQADSGLTYMKTEAYIVISTGDQVVFNIMDYSATDKHKTALIRFDSSSNGVVMSANRWASTSAVTSVQVFTSTSSFPAGTTMALYGIAA